VPATISALFMIGSLAFALSAIRAANARAAIGWGALSMASLVLALLSKEQAAVTPALLLAALLSLGAGPRRAAATRLVLLQTLLVAVYFLALRPAVLGSALTGVPPIGGSLATQWLTAIASWPRQLGWLFAPLRSSTSDTRVVTRPFGSRWGSVALGSPSPGGGSAARRPDRGAGLA
jgi:hypothetical protein